MTTAIKNEAPNQAANAADLSTTSRYRGCLLGGAVGDALGAPVEFMSRQEILGAFGPDGITEFAPAYGGIGTITDDTQMTLFTASGLIGGWVRGVTRGMGRLEGPVAGAYLRWLQTQEVEPTCDMTPGPGGPGWLFAQKALHSRRAPGNTCLSALRDMERRGIPASNNSKGCGGVMRVAPVGLFTLRWPSMRSPRHAFRLGTALAALTHGHPTGSLTGGVLAVLIYELANGATLRAALAVAKSNLMQHAGHEETLQAIEHAETLAASKVSPANGVDSLGEGWVAEEALAISIYCALIAQDFRQGVILAVNHDGDSDSTGAITGNLLGAQLGVEAIPPEWLEQLELRDVIAELADDLTQFPSWDFGNYAVDDAFAERICRKYPPH